MARQPYYPYSPNTQAPDAGDGSNDYENLFRATKAGPYPAPGGVGMQPPPEPGLPAPAPVDPPQPMYPSSPPTLAPHNPRIAPTPPTLGPMFNSFDPSSDTPTASPAQPANPAMPGPASPAPSAPAAGQPTTGWQTPGSGDTGNDWLGFLQQFLGRNMVSRGSSQGGYFEGGNQYRGNLQSIVDAYNQAKGAHAAVGGDDKIDFGDGRGPQDVITGAGDFWYGGPPGSMQPGAGGSGGVGSVGSNGMLTGSVDASAGGGGDLSGGYRQAILNALKQFGTPTDLNSPTLQPQLSAARLANQRGTDRVRKALAERAFAGGTLHSSEYDQQTQQALEHAGEAETGTEAGIVGQAEQQRLTMLRQLLGQGNQYLTDQERMALQQELAGGQLGYQYAALQNSMNRDALLAQLGYYGG